MSWLDVEIETYIDDTGKIYNVRRRKPIEEKTIRFTGEYSRKTELFEIVDKIYGKGLYQNVEDIIDANSRDFLERDFNLLNVKQIKIPEV